MKFVNVRGCNGSGKTTLLRSLARDPLCRVVSVNVPDHSPIPVTYVPGGLAILGDYTPAAAGSTTAGCDRIKTQAATKGVLEHIASDPEVDIVLFEGVVVSTIFGPWMDWAVQNGGMAWAFLDTPLEVCLSRIQQRNGGKPIKEDQVGDKHRTIARVREKALAHGQYVVDLGWETALRDIKRLISFMKDPSPGEEDGPWAKGYAERSAPGPGITSCCVKPNISPRGVCISCGAPQ